MRPMTLQDWLILCLLALLWGGTFLYSEIALEALGPLSIVAIRVTLAALFLWLIVFVFGIERPRGAAMWGKLWVMGFINNAVPFSCIVWAQVHITSGVAAILNATTPFFIVIVAHILTEDEKLNWNKGIGVAVWFLGVVLMIGPGALTRLDFTSLGQLTMLCATLCYSFAGIWGKRLKSLHPVMAATGMLTAASSIMIPVAIVVEGAPQTWPPMNAVLALLAFALLGTVAAFMIYFRLLNTVGATNLLLVTFLVPLVAVTLGTLVLDEPLGGEAIIGMVTIGLGLALVDGRLLRWIIARDYRWRRQ